MRGQANLPAVAIALLVITTVAGLSVAVADSAFVHADRDAPERTTATTLTDRFVAADSPVTERRNVLVADRIDDDAVDSLLPPNRDIRVSIDDDVVYEHGDPTDGTTTRRLVLVAEKQNVTVEPRLEFGEMTLPRRSARATVDIDPNASVETVRANDRVVLYDPDGVEGEHEIALSRYETTTLRFDGTVDDGDVRVMYYPDRTRKAILEVTVSD